MKRLLIVLLLLSGVCFAQRKPIAVGAGGAAGACTLNGAAANDILQMTSGSACANASPGITSSRTVATTPVTLNCSNATGDRSKVLILSSASAQTLNEDTGTNACGVGAVVKVYVSNATGNVTFNPDGTDTCNGASTCTNLTQGEWTLNKYASGVWTATFGSLLPTEHVISWDVTATGDAKTYLPVYFACTIYAVDVTADQAGVFASDIDRSNAAIPNTTTDKISGTDGPALTGPAQINLNHAPSSWGSVALVSGDVLNLNVTTFTTVTHVHVQLRCH